MYDDPKKTNDILLRILATLGGDCGPNNPQVASNNNAGAATNFLRRTRYNGTDTPPTPQAAINADAIENVGYALYYNSAWNEALIDPDVLPAASRRTTTPIRVYFNQPSPNEGYVVLYPGMVLRRSRGWPRVWITTDSTLLEEFFPVIVVCTDPSIVIEGARDGCCEGEEDVISLSASDSAAQVIAAAVAAPMNGVSLTIPAGQGGDWNFHFHSIATGANGDGYVSYAGTIRVNGVSAGAFTTSGGFAGTDAGAINPTIDVQLMATIFGLSAGDVVVAYLNPISVAAPYDTGGIELGARTAFALKVG